MQSLTAAGVTSLMKISPKLITLYLRIRDGGVEYFNATLNKMFPKNIIYSWLLPCK